MSFSFVRRLSWVFLFLCLPFSLWAEFYSREPIGPSGRRTGIAISEIHYHPADRSDGRNLRFVEIYNSNPFIEDISGWKFQGAIQYTLPSNTILAANSFLVVAAVPGDLEAVYGITGVLGGWTGNLPDSGGRLQLLKRSGAIVLDLSYSDRAPWPIASAGFGPSLVLSRPTYGEADPRAWAASTRFGGSPGQDDPVPSGPIESIVLNEVLALPLFGGESFIELFNRGADPVDLSGAWLGAGSVSNRFQIPFGSVVPGGAALAFHRSELGFDVNPAGDQVLLFAADQQRILDAIELEGQQAGVSVGRQPEGSELIRALEQPTPSALNAPLLIRNVVINEIFYAPPSRDSDEAFVELYNWSETPVDLSGWRFISGIAYTFPSHSVISAKGFLVVAKNPERFKQVQSGTPQAIVLGPFSGSISGRGERLAVAAPCSVVVGEALQTAWVVQDEVNFRTGGRWGKWSDGGGSSLELIHPRSDHSSPSSWADSDETAKSEWSSLEQTGKMDMLHPSTPTGDQLQFLLWDAGEMLIDDVEILVNGQNRMVNSGFSTNSTNWAGQGTHRQTRWENTLEGGTQTLHVIATDRGDQVANRVRGKLLPAIPVNSIVTLRAKVRWLTGTPDYLFRLRGGGFDFGGTAPMPQALGTAGRPNSRAASNTPPFIAEVSHFPVFPTTNDLIRVTARVTDPDGLASVMLRYRIDPTNTLFDIPMTDSGTGADPVAGDKLYTAEIPAQKKGKLVAFRIEAVDRYPIPARSVFPEEAPRRECLVRVGETNVAGGFATYHLWVTQSNITYWTGREKMSNEGLDATFIYGTNRVIYNASTRYAGSYYTVPTYDTPVGSPCGYDIVCPDDNRVLGESHFTMDWPIRDPTNQREQLMFWFLEQYDLPNNYRRYVNLYVNGVKRDSGSGKVGILYDDVQQPDGNLIREWFPQDSNGVLIKTDCWDEFADNGLPVGGVNNCQLNGLDQFLDPDGNKKTARYRWNWRPRAVKKSANNYTDMFTLVDAVNLPDPKSFLAAVSVVVDVDHWMRTFAMNDLASYWDAFGNPNSKNTYLYKPDQSGWKLFSWDFDVGLGVFNDEPQAPLFPDNVDPAIKRMYGTPELLRPYWGALDEAVNGFFKSGPGLPIDLLLASKFAAFKTNRVLLDDPAPIRTWINQRRAYLTNQLRAVNAPFRLTAPVGSSGASSSNSVILTGTAPPSLKSIRVNGRTQQLAWTTITNWNTEVLLEPGANVLTLEAFDRLGLRLPGASASLTVTYAGPSEPPLHNLVINEILFQPLVEGSQFVEILNLASSTSYDISGWRLDGVGLVFPEGTIIHPGDFRVVVKDRVQFGQTYGWSIPVAGIFPGNLILKGETLALVRSGLAPSGDEIIHSVVYSSDLPWPVQPGDLGISMQLVDPDQDSLRSSNWGSSVGPASTNAFALLSLDATWRYDDTGVDPKADWITASFDDSSWPAAQAVFFNSKDTFSFPKATPVRMTNEADGSRVLTHYFRTTFDLSNAPAIAHLRLWAAVDDGAVFYLNGQEVFRLRMPAGPLTSKTLASAAVNKAVLEGPFTLTVTNLLAGTNQFAVEVHQTPTNSTDVIFGARLRLENTLLAWSTPGSANGFDLKLSPYPALWLSEVEPINTQGLADAAGEHDPWVELYNSGTSPVDLGGLWLSDDYGNLARWSFPPNTILAAGQFRLVWLDGQLNQNSASELHAAFRISGSSGSVVLSRRVATSYEVIDYLNYEGVGADNSFGKFPENSPANPRLFAYPTAGSKNSLATPPATVWINEWMAGNTLTFADPADGQYEDWFELYNPASNPVDLSGYTLTDDLSVPGKFKIPIGYSLAPHGYLLVWADQETDQSRPEGDLHVNFKLSSSGEAIGLYDPTGSRIDSVKFATQTDDVSQGRFPDGAPAPFVLMQVPTPRRANSNAVPTRPSIAILAAEPMDGGGLRLIWRSRVGSLYQLQTRDSLTEGDWTSVGNPVRGIGDQSSQVDPLASKAAQRFYRVLLR